MSSIKLKRFVNIYTGNSISDNDKEKYTNQNKNTIPYISTKDIELGSNKVNYFNDMYIDIEENKKFKIANKGDILLCIEGGSAGKKIARLDYDVCFVNKLCCFKGSDKVYNDFLYYYLQSDLFLSQFNLNMSGLIGGVSQSLIKEFNIPLLSKERQKKIANYLDNKVSLIDETIENNKKEIELLDEYKKNIFSDVIKEYNFKNYKLKYLTNKKLQYGANSSGVVYRDDLPRYVRITDILNNTLKEQDKLSLQEDKAKDFILKDGDILFARSGGTVGKSFMYENKFGRCAFAGYLIRASFNNKELAQYVYNFTNSVLYEKWKNSIFIQSTIQNIGADKYSNMLIPIPIDFDNVVRVNNKINKIIIKLDKVIEYRNQIIEKLEEYKKSLIYEAVTGKIEV